MHEVVLAARQNVNNLRKMVSRIKLFMKDTYNTTVHA